MARKTAKKARAKAPAKKTAKPAAKKKKVVAKKKKARKAKAKGLGGRVANAFNAVVETFEEAGRLRNKLEQPGTSETE